MDIRLNVDVAAVTNGPDVMSSEMVKAAQTTVNYGLNEIEQAQILRYTSISRPSRPPGSTYIRTFKLRRSSRKRKAAKMAFSVEGTWWADPSTASYAPFVIGHATQQATIHAGRWRSLEEVTKRVARKIGNKLAEEVSKITTRFNR